jgi:hypothetical protein
MRIKQLNNSDLETMIEAVGVRYRVKCDEINNVLIRQTLQSEFAAMLVVDFNNAFIKHCSGKFMISKEAEGNKPYGDLSCLFICDVLKGFKVYKAKEIAKPQLVAPIEKQLPMSKETIEKTQEKHFHVINDWHKQNGEVPLIANWSEAFLHMERIELIKVDYDEKQMFLENVVFDLNSERKRLKHEGSNYGHITNMLDSKVLLKKEARKRFIIKYYENK